jgi:hypothetical protein
LSRVELNLASVSAVDVLDVLSLSAGDIPDARVLKMIRCAEVFLVSSAYYCVASYSRRCLLKSLFRFE